MKLTAATADKHVLYEASVQCVEADLDFFDRLSKRRRGRPFRILKEDFCGTAALATEFVRRHPENQAWGVDLHKPTLDWGIGGGTFPGWERKQDRVTLVRDDVMDVNEPKVELVAALNFSYGVFKTRDDLREVLQERA